jgi:hypothetical protein
MAICIDTLWVGDDGDHLASCRPLRVWHSIEIHPDGLIIDERLSYSVDAMGENWPSLQMVDDDPDRLVFCGIVGTRFIEFATANRLHSKHDRTPEVLAADLELAMEQLWGRRENNVPLDGPEFTG